MRVFVSMAGLAALAWATMPSAFAQQGTPYEQASIAAASACFAADPTTDAATTVRACNALLGGMAGLRASFEPLGSHDQNVDLVVRTMAISRVGRAYSILDGGVRSSRVCTEMENAWGLVSRMNPSASPQYSDTMATLRQSQIDVVRKCRNEMGAPAGAVPLP